MRANALDCPDAVAGDPDPPAREPHHEQDLPIRGRQTPVPANLPRARRLDPERVGPVVEKPDPILTKLGPRFRRGPPTKPSQDHRE
jgi:hypothetical protein